MKKKGNVSDFKPQRDRELNQAFLQLLRTRSDLTLGEMFGAAAQCPASRFWVSEPRAAIVISRMMQGLDLGRILPKRLEMYEEILRRTTKILSENPGMSLTRAVDEAVNTPAPEFYLTPKSAKVIIYRIRERRRRLAKLHNTLKP